MAKVMVVEDNQTHRYTAVEALRAAGYTAEGVTCGARALERMREGFHPDLFVIDMHLPLECGSTFIAVLSHKSPELKIIATSADPLALPPNVPNLLKPFAAEQLVDAVDKLLGASAVRR